MYSVEFGEPRHEEGALRRAFAEETAQVIGSLVFANGQTRPFEVVTIFEDGDIPANATKFDSRVDAINAVFDDPQAEAMVSDALDSAFSKNYAELTERVS